MKKTIGKWRKEMKVIFVIWLISFFIVQGFILSDAKLDPMDQINYIVVLGAGLKGETLSQTLFYRMSKALEYLHKYPNAKIVVSGGQGKGEDISEAEGMKRFLIDKGIDENRIIKEDQSTNTLENIKFSKNILHKIEKKEINEFVIITNGFHLYRAKLLARRNGIIPHGIPCKTEIYQLPKYYLREYFAVIKSWIFDK
ncbi:YdcF family protein [Inediibacterium massiliense]|uniref:YdcF family protein n=1 Tax=Inediibacterium massiliense TaxID=1658111 RepID=UPI0006B49105|nr:YdcF family protein [Inediibacterium massiliense]